MPSPELDRVNHFRQRWAEENFHTSFDGDISRQNIPGQADPLAGIDTFPNSLPTSRPAEKSKRISRNSWRSSFFGRSEDRSSRLDTPQQKPDSERLSDEEADALSDVFSKKDQNQASSAESPQWLTELYTLSWLIFFSLLGTLARLGVETITLYPSAPVTSRVLWANLGGSFTMGFLIEDRSLFKQPVPDQEKRRLSASSEAVAEHMKFKKTVPLYVGLTVGFCGSFTSFSSFIRDAFLALTNDLESPNPTTPYRSASRINSRNGGFSFLATLSILIIHPAVSMAALQVGAHLAQLLKPILKPIHTGFLNKVLNPLMIPLSIGCWLGASLVLSVIPPYNVIDWRTRALFPLIFAPIGTLLRYYLSKTLNSRLPSFPLGTFVANIFATLVLGMCYDIQHAEGLGSNPLGSANVCAIMVGIMEGFCGCLSTVSTWVAEIQSLHRKHGWIYGGASVAVGLGALVCIMGGMGWTIGFGKPVCG